MCEIQCKICGEKFEGQTSGREKRKLSNHLIKVHNLETSKYVMDYYNNGIWPLCACGCGTPVEFKKWQFLKYYKDHKNKAIVSNEVKEKISKGLSNSNKIGFKFSKSQLEEWYDLYKKGENNSKEMQKLTGVDFRTLSKYWVKNGIANGDEIRHLTMKHKYVWANKGTKNGAYQFIDEDLLTEIFYYIRSNSGKHTIKVIKEKFGIKNSSLVLRKRLIEKFGEGIDKYFRMGNISKPEGDFGFVLKFYFGEKNVKRQFRLEKKIYDFKIGDRLLVEYDGEYWHRNKKDIDKEKEDIAIRNGYVLFRVSDKNDRDISILTTIRSLLNEIQVSSCKESIKEKI
jgi:very-short-patch-repair endonuclease